jgi:SAM-dependent methyltransferase
MSEPRVDCDALAAIYGDGVDVYDRIWSPVILPGALPVVDAMKLGEGARVLDVGAGTGALTEALRAAAPDATIVSIDPSPAMLRYAREHRCARALVGDAAALAFPSRSVDGVLLAYMLFHMLDPLAGLREAARVVRASGRVGTVTWASEEPARASRIWEDALNELGVPVLSAHGNHSGLDRTDAIEQLLRAGGLRPIDVWVHDLEHTFTPEAFWAMRTGCGSIRARLAAIDPGLRRRVLAEAQRRLEPLAPMDYTFRGRVVCSVSEPTGGDSEEKRWQA